MNPFSLALLFFLPLASAFVSPTAFLTKVSLRMANEEKATESAFKPPEEDEDTLEKVEKLGKGAAKVRLHFKNLATPSSLNNDSPPLLTY